VTAERWLPIPDPEGYEVSDRENVRGVDRIVVRSNGVPYTVRGRAIRVQIHQPTGLKLVKLATGRRGRCRTVYIHKLMEAVFGGSTSQQTSTRPQQTPANSTRPCNHPEPPQQASPDGHHVPRSHCIAAGQRPIGRGASHL
jgi:NUMOD4 motif